MKKIDVKYITRLLKSSKNVEIIYNSDALRLKVKRKIEQKLKENMCLMNQGKLHEYQMNCNFLSGIHYVMSIFKL